MNRWLSISLVTMSLLVHAEPEVIADFGGRETGFKSPKEQLQEAALRTRITTANSKPSMTGRFPILSRLRVGVLENSAHSLPVTRPFFIVGFDQQSAQWLAANQQYLTEINALGFVTNVNTPAQLEKLQAYAGELPLNAIPVDEIARQFNLTRYPVLVTQEKIIQ